MAKLAQFLPSPFSFTFAMCSADLVKQMPALFFLVLHDDVIKWKRLIRFIYYASTFACCFWCDEQLQGYFIDGAFSGMSAHDFLNHRGRVTHICVSKLTIIASDNGLSPGRRQAIIWTSAGILLIGPLGTNVSEILVEIITVSFTKMRLKVSSAKWRPCCLGLNALIL